MSVGYWETHGNCRRLTLPDGGLWRHWPWLQNDNSPSPGLPVGGVSTKLGQLVTNAVRPKKTKTIATCCRDHEPATPKTQATDSPPPVP